MEGTINNIIYFLNYLSNICSKHPYDYFTISVLALLGICLAVGIYYSLYMVLTYILKKIIKKPSSKVYDKNIKRAKLEFSFISSLIYSGVKVFVIFMCISFIAPNSFSFFGAFSISLALIFKPDLENLSAGLALIFTDKLKIGDKIVIKDMEGIVEDLNINYMLLNSGKEKIMIPNLMISQEIIVKKDETK